MQHSFEVEDAVKYGVEKAIILNNLRFWLAKNKANRKNMGDGYYWTYNSAEAFTELFPYITRRSMSRYLNELEESGEIISSLRCDNKLNRTKSYSMPEFAIDPHLIEVNCIDQNDQPIGQNDQPIGQNGQCTGQIGQCYTDINNTDINKHKREKNKDLSISTKSDDSDKIHFVFEYWKQTMDSARSRLDENRKRLIRNALKKYTDTDLQMAIYGCSLSPFHMGQNPDGKKYNGLDLILRNAEKIESFINMATNPPVQKSSSHIDNDDTSWVHEFGEAY